MRPAASSCPEAVSDSSVSFFICQLFSCQLFICQRFSFSAVSVSAVSVSAFSSQLPPKANVILSGASRFARESAGAVEGPLHLFSLPKTLQGVWPKTSACSASRNPAPASYLSRPISLFRWMAPCSAPFACAAANLRYCHLKRGRGTPIRGPQQARLWLVGVAIPRRVERPLAIAPSASGTSSITSTPCCIIPSIASATPPTSSVSCPASHLWA